MKLLAAVAALAFVGGAAHAQSMYLGDDGSASMYHPPRAVWYQQQPQQQLDTSPLYVPPVPRAYNPQTTTCATYGHVTNCY